MCLVVAKVPSQKQIIICKKRLTIPFDDERFVTPFLGKKVPKNGWLFPTTFKTGQFIYDSVIHGGVIHAFTDIKSEFFLYNYYRAYAFGVEAYNKEMTELVCRALYIPSADTRKPKDTEEIILGFGRYSKAKILEKLPILERIEQYL